MGWHARRAQRVGPRLPRSDIDARYRSLVDDIAATLDDPGGTARLSRHLEGDADPGVGDPAPPPDGGRAEVIVDRRGRLIGQNAAAAAQFGLPPGGDLADIAVSVAALQRFLAAQADSADPAPLAVARADGQTVFLFGRRTEAGGPLLLTEVRPGIGHTVRARLAEAVGLTASEGPLLDRLSAGQPLDAIARDLGRTEGTVRQQVKAIMAKMGVNSQRQVIATAYALSLMYAHSAGAAAQAANAVQGATLHHGPHGTVGLHQFGPADGMAVLLCHGALFGIGAQPAARASAATLGLRVIAPERPGFGHTRLPDGADPVALATAQTLHLLDSLALRRVVVLAHDIGTRFAARLALVAPDRVAAVVAAPATPPMQTWAQTADMPTRHRVNAWAAQHLPGLMDRIVALGLSQIARSGVDAIPRLVFDGCDFDQAVLRRPEAAPVLTEAFELAWAQRGAGFRADMRLTNENWVDEARRIAVPVLCLRGSESRTVSRSAVEGLARTLPQGRFRAVDGAGHSLPVSHAALVLRTALAAGHAAGLGADEVPG
jgi:pimeloyl-ACP methyl ester carboxylesterase/DNA-binding CsgD family transcriptional regulator